jgi:hypothetical protein
MKKANTYLSLGNYLITLETEFDTKINGIINKYEFSDSIEIVVED